MLAIDKIHGHEALFIKMPTQKPSKYLMKIDSDAMFFARSVVIRFCVSDRELGIIVRATNRTFICGVTTWQAQKCNKDGRE